MTTYVICDNPECGEKFKSKLIQVTNIEAQEKIGGNKEQCPHCGFITLVEKRNIVNE